MLPTPASSPSATPAVAGTGSATATTSTTAPSSAASCPARSTAACGWLRPSSGPKKFETPYATDVPRARTIASTGHRYPRSTMIEQLVEQIEARFADAERQMSDPEVIGNRERYAEVGRTYRQLEPAAKLATEWRRAASDAAGARELLSEGGEDAEMREEGNAARQRLHELDEEIRLAMVERDPNDDKNVIV